MNKHLTTFTALSLSLGSFAIADPGATVETAPTVAAKGLSALADEKLDFIQHVEVQGENPTVIYVPIVHDGPMNHLASTNIDNCKAILGESQQIAAHLYGNYGVKNILLEGCGKAVADHYNNSDRKGKKISFAHTKMVTFETWGNVLNENRWQLAATGERPEYGPLSVLGSEYTSRIHKALETSKNKGFFATRNGFVENQAEFTKLISDAAEGYNEKRAKILEDDPLLKKEYEITVSKRNEDFIKSITEAEGVGIIMCGAGHIHDMKSQLEAKGISYAVVVPKSLEWPIKEKTEDEIYADMLKQGCQLKSCNLKFGDGTGANIKIPID